MPGANNILPFAQGGGANVQSQISYAADAQRPQGNQPGNARSSFVNKIMRQCAAMAAGLAQFTAANQGSDVDDTLTPAGMRTLIEAALAGYLAARQGADQDLVTGASSGYIRFPGGFMIQWVVGTTDVNGDVTVTLPQAFTSQLLGGHANELNSVGWLTNSCTVHGFDASTSTLTTVTARVRNVTPGGVAEIAGVGVDLLVWGK